MYRATSIRNLGSNKAMMTGTATMYTGYMALHTALTTNHGSVWRLDDNMKLVQVVEEEDSQANVYPG